MRADEGFASVTGPCRFRFPEDHGVHRDHRTEWWYWTGNVTDSLGRRYGFQLTFFRVALAPPADRKTWPEPASAWRTDQVFFAHGAVTGVAGKVHRQAETLSRDALGLAGASGSPAGTALFVGAWSAEMKEDGHRLKAVADDFSLDLVLVPRKGPVAHGRGGFSPKGGRPGASELLLLVYPSRRFGDPGHRRRLQESRRAGVDGPRIQHRAAGRRPGGVGLVRPAALRRQRTDGLPASAGRRELPQRLRRHLCPAGGRCKRPFPGTRCP